MIQAALLCLALSRAGAVELQAPRAATLETPAGPAVAPPALAPAAALAEPASAETAGLSAGEPAPAAATASASDEAAAVARRLEGPDAGEALAEAFDGSADAKADFQATDNSVVRVADVDRALARLRAGSYPRDSQLDAAVALIVQRHPDLPLSADRLFIVKDEAVLRAFTLPSVAGGAARVLSDGRRQEPVVLLVAPDGVGLDDFVEFSIHEAIHLADAGILHVSHVSLLEHWIAEGYTQLRAHQRANASLPDFGRPPRRNGAYSLEVELAEQLIAAVGEGPLRALVRRGDANPLRTALGDRWDGLQALVAKDRPIIERRRHLFLLIVKTVVAFPDFGPQDFARALDRLENNDREIGRGLK